jgi:mannosyltransferase
LRKNISFHELPGKFIWLLGVILLLAGFLRLYTVNNHGVWIDETWVVTTPNFHYGSDDIFPKFFDYPQVKALPEKYQALARQIYHLHPICQIAFMLVSDVHPPFYYVTSYYWTRLFGESLYSIRSLPMLYGLISIVILALLVRKLLGEPIALLSALFLALSPTHVHLNQQARSYSLMGMLVIASFYFFYPLLKESFKWKYVAGYSLAILLAMLTHYYAVFFVISQLLLAFFYEIRGGRRILRWLAIYAVVAFCYLPWLPAQAIQMFIHRSAPPPPEMLSTFSFSLWLKQLYFVGPIPSLTVRFFSQTFFDGLLLINMVILTSIIILGIWRTKKEERARLNYFLIWAILPVLWATLLALLKPLYAVKSLFPVLPAFAVLMVWGIMKLPSMCRKIMLTLLFVAMVLSQLLYSTYPGIEATEDTRGCIEKVGNLIRETDVVVVEPGFYRDGLWYYLKRDYVMRDRGSSLEDLSKSGRVWLFKYGKKEEKLPCLHDKTPGDFYRFYNISVFMWDFK